MKSLTTTFSQAKTTLALLFISLLSSAQNSLPVDKATNKVTYRFSIPTNNVSNEDAFTQAQNWFAIHKSECSRANTTARLESCDGINTKSRDEVAKVFANNTPLQSLDPASNRMTAKMITKYVGNQGGTIQAMYLQYYLMITIADGQINCEISDIRYNHFNKRSYRFQRVLNWNNATSLEPVDKIEYLIENEQSHDEFNLLYSFLNKDINQLFENLSNHMKTNQSVSMK